jgi:hypothetical protein
MNQPTNDDAAFNLRRKAAAAYLTASGFPTAAATLAKLASIGGGPRFVSFGRLPMYSRQELLAWARARTTKPRTSTSDRQAAA